MALEYGSGGAIGSAPLERNRPDAATIVRASFPASRDRYAGLSGPAVKELREG